jgi:hypothetical protein
MIRDNGFIKRDFGQSLRNQKLFSLEQLQQHTYAWMNISNSQRLHSGLQKSVETSSPLASPNRRPTVHQLDKGTGRALQEAVRHLYLSVNCGPLWIISVLCAGSIVEAQIE